MSKIIPRETIDVLRHQVDVSLDNFGIDCELYIPTNISFDAAQKLDIFATVEDYSYIGYQAKIFIDWNPNVYRLKKLGLYTEGDLPILVYFGNKAIPLEDSEGAGQVDIDVILHSYFVVEPEYIPENYKGVEAFDIVNTVVKGMHDAILVQGFLAAPRRI